MGKGDMGDIRRVLVREAVGAVRDPDEVCPYQGLAPFESDRSELFFGRRRAVRDLLERLAPRLREGGCILLVSGASGVGKSSLLRAGVIPALAEDTPLPPGSRSWPRLLVTPTAEPFRALAEAWAQAYGGGAEEAGRRLRARAEETGERVRRGRARTAEECGGGRRSDPSRSLEGETLVRVHYLYGDVLSTGSVDAGG
ncbi:ATP-binding protein [[Actinomadura] parvosata]|uniref:ATP-binding protein n=1 Tax=[Actinomadura] parvosata TaxID=1955412 RepID=UPI00406CE0FD